MWLCTKDLLSQADPGGKRGFRVKRSINECVIEKYRAKHDVWNSVASGCVKYILGNVSPIFKRYIESVLKTKPKTPFRVANGVSFVRIDQKTGMPSNSGILEVFKQGKEPFEQFILDDKSNIIKPKDSLSGTGGLILN